MELRHQRWSSLSQVSRWRKVLNFLGVAFLVVVGLEGSLRLAGAILSRRVSLTVPAEAGVATVVCLGDSWTEGAVDGRYPEMLEQRLNQREKRRRYRVVNLGLSGTNSSQAFRRLVSWLDELHPDLVVVMTGNNDHWNLSDSEYWTLKEQDMSPSAVLAARIRVFGRSLRVVRAASFLWSRARGRPTPNEFFSAESPATAPSAQPAPAGGAGAPERASLVAIDRRTHRLVLERNLARFIELSRSKHFALVFMNYFQFHAFDVDEIIADFALENGVPLVNQTVRFHQLIAPGERSGYLIPDGHPNPRGYAFLTDGLVDVLERERLIPAAP
jgi:lysophospholipase L1-like esterase